MRASFYERAPRRILRLTVIVGIAGAATTWLAMGLRPALGFLAGAVLSGLNFYWLWQLVQSLGPSGKAPARGSAILLSFRYLLIAGVVYVIVKGLGVTPAAVLWGLLAAFAAVILEILYELIFHARV
jgi:hypothetical protein